MKDRHDTKRRTWTDSPTRARLRSTARVPFILLLATATVGAAQIWLTQSRRQIALDLDDLNEQIAAAEDGIDEAHIDAEQFYAPDRVSDVAAEMSFVKIAETPVVVGDETKAEWTALAESDTDEDETRVYGPSAQQAAFLMGFPQIPKGDAAAR